MKLSERLPCTHTKMRGNCGCDRCRAADLLGECERAVEAVIEDQTTGGGDDTFPIAKTLLAKLRKERADE